MCFQRESSVFKFPRHGVDGNLLVRFSHLPAPATLVTWSCTLYGLHVCAPRVMNPTLSTGFMFFLVLALVTYFSRLCHWLHSIALRSDWSFQLFLFVAIQQVWFYNSNHKTAACKRTSCEHSKQSVLTNVIIF